MTNFKLTVKQQKKFKKSVDRKVFSDKIRKSLEGDRENDL